MQYTENQEINGRYRLVEFIGRGSFGEVWKAEDKVSGIMVAIKIYASLDGKGLKEFRDEYKTVYSLRHTNLLRSDYFDVTDQQPFLIMPICTTSTANMVGEMTEDELWRFIYDVAKGLEYLHANDVIHRDIKPDNILRDEQGNYVISDFGLSLKMKSTLRKASGRVNESSGTVCYMAPEMFTSKPSAVKATDIWALGASIYELAAGEMPFMGQGGVMELHGAQMPELPPHYSRELNDLVTACLAKETWDRPTASAIVERLRPSSTKQGAEMPQDCMPIEQHNAEIQQWQHALDEQKDQYEKNLQQTGGGSGRGVKIWAWIASIVAVIGFIMAYKHSENASYWLNESYNRSQEYDQLSTAMGRLQDEANQYREALGSLLQESPILATNIKVWNSGQEGQDIVSSQSTYIYHSADFISKKNIAYEDVMVKFIAPWGLSSGKIDGKNSPSGYSYPVKVNLSPYKPEKFTSSGWGGTDKGQWSSGQYRIEYWYGGKCIGSKSFKVK